MIERKRAARGYNAVAGDDDLDVELGEDVGGQETGVVRSTVDNELDNWDENAEDWEDDQVPESSHTKPGPEGSIAEKRSD